MQSLTMISYDRLQQEENVHSTWDPFWSKKAHNADNVTLYKMDSGHYNKNYKKSTTYP